VDLRRLNHHAQAVRSPGTATHYVPDRPVAVSHVCLSLEPDLAAHTLQGQSRLDLTARRDGLDQGRAKRGGHDHRTGERRRKAGSGVDYDGECLRIPLGRTFERGERFSLAVDYRCKPRRVSTSSGLTRPP